MSKPNFTIMSIDELRQYILEHRDDDDAVHEMVLRIQAEGKTGTVDEFITSVKQKSQQNQ
jgi:hypothetical protein